MREELRALGFAAKEYLRKFDLAVAGLHYYIERRPQMRDRGMMLCFDVVTHNPHFFGAENYPRRGSRIVLPMHDFLREKITGPLAEYSISMDVYVRLVKPLQPSGPMSGDQSPVARIVSAKMRREVSFVRFQDLVASGEISSDSMFNHYCRHYGLEHVLKQGPLYISPDSASVEALEAICAVRKVNSVLEIGAGVGTCGRAAERMGIRDFTFVDIRSEVCDYLRERFRYPVIQQNAFDFDFDRRWDLVLIGMDWELNPWFLAQRGPELAASADVVFFNSGAPAYFEFEHDWINGKKSASGWPWWSQAQTLPSYFPAIIEANFDWQLSTVAMRSSRDEMKIRESMQRRGFSYVRCACMEFE